jgi:hypothetical protein
MRDITKDFYSMTLDQQEAYLSKRLVKVHELEDKVKDMLKQVRGGMKIKAAIDERPDLEYDIQQLKKGESI